ncbi:MAG TPA: methyltransferase domain-containing protein [Gaiellaceae bacterium]|jgi:SAM-dependent methyltransferase|nr:methyltransferase domain-containing protein [Gaiellaceae bacterium]
MRLPAFRRAPSEYDEEFIDTMASAYLERTAWTELRLEAVRSLVEPRPGDRVLDLGCAAGAISHYLSTLDCGTVGVDAEPLAVEKARQFFPGLDFQLANVARLPFEDASFDKAVAADLVEHLDDETFRAMLRETHRVLRPGGTLSLYTPNPRHPIERLKARDLILAQNPTHIGLRDAPTLEAMMREEGYEVDRSEWRASFIRGLSFVERRGGGSFESLRYRLCVRGRR